MVFSSLIFLYLFLPLCIALYYLVRPISAKNVILLIFSLLFYAWGEPIYVFLLIGSALINYWIGRGMEQENSKKKLLLGLAVAIDLLALGVFKYAGLAVETLNFATGLSLPVPKIALPIGISFYTFQIMTYVVDVYRGQAKVQRSFVRFLLYVSMFPQLIAGPIVRYSDIEAQLNYREHTTDGAFYGMLRFATGLGKKVLIADYAGKISASLLDGQLAFSTSVGLWFGILMFAFQLYFDFSGYSDMAIGLGHLFGFKFRENFDRPYMSKSITEFWRRWHISLGTFFRDYVYIPLGGNRKRKYLNLLITWALTGLWHGASWNFLLWGVYFFLLLSVEKLLMKWLRYIPGILRVLGTFFLVLMGWTLFYFTDFTRLLTAVKVMFGAGGAGFINTQIRVQMLNALPLLLVCALGATRLPKMIGEGIGLLCATKDSNGKKQIIYVALTFLFCLVLLALATVSLVGSSYSPFLYYRF